jgi:hypothetical protein
MRNDLVRELLRTIKILREGGPHDRPAVNSRASMQRPAGWLPAGGAFRRPWEDRQRSERSVAHFLFPFWQDGERFHGCLSSHGFYTFNSTGMFWPRPTQGTTHPYSNNTISTLRAYFQRALYRTGYLIDFLFQEIEQCLQTFKTVTLTSVRAFE